MFLQLLSMNKFAIVCHSFFFLFVHNVLWMIILIIPEMNIIDYHFNLTSWSLFFNEKDNRNKIEHIPHVGVSLFTDVWLLALKVFRHLHKSYLRYTMGQTRQSSITIINTERSYANHLKESMDTIIDIFGKKKLWIFSF